MTATVTEMAANLPATTLAQRRWLSVVSHLDPKYGGLSAAVPELGAAVAAAAGPAVHVAAFCHADEHYRPAAGASAVEISYWPFAGSPWAMRATERRQLEALVAQSDGIHLHGLWTESTRLTAELARRTRTPYIVSAHGMLEPWALRSKRLKKSVYGAIWERRNLRAAACLHALNRAEAEDYRRYGLRGPVAIVPNGVRIPAEVSSASFLERYPPLRGKQLVLFLGRIHPKKGVDLALRAWAELAPTCADAHLVLAGPHAAESPGAMERLAAELGLHERVTFTGMLEGALKWSALAAAACFVLPSHSEGMSVSLLEALGMGLPVILTDRCHLPEVKEAGAGWEIRPDAGELASALRECLRNSEAENRRIGARGAGLVQSRFNWGTIGAQMRTVYDWVEGGGPMPSDVEIDAVRERA